MYAAIAEVAEEAYSGSLDDTESLGEELVAGCAPLHRERGAQLYT